MSGSDTVRVGFIGLGGQGAPMARRIIEAGFPTTLWARRSATLERFGDTSASIADSPAALAAASDLVCVCVVNDADVEQVVAGGDGVLAGLGEGGLIAVHSTVHPDTCRRLAERAAAQGVTLVDAPVSGGGAAAAEGRLLVMAGGGEEDVERCRTVFACHSDRVVHLGPVGAGQVAKLLNNVLFAANLATAAQALALGRELEVDSGRLAEVMAHGSGASFALGAVAGVGGTVGPIADIAGPLLRKDARLMADLAAAAKASPGIVMAAADDVLARMDHPR